MKFLICYVLTTVLLCVTGVFFCAASDRKTNEQREQQTVDSIKDIASAAVESYTEANPESRCESSETAGASREPSSDGAEEIEPTSPGGEGIVSASDTASDSGANGASAAKYNSLHEINPDYAGWLKIDGTDIDYPVMHADAQEPEFYLKHDFYKNYSVSGVPFLASDSVLPGDMQNMIIHGHNLKSGKMFSQLLNYADKSFFEQYSTICFETSSGCATYKICAVLYTDANDIEESAFYSYCDLTDKDTFKAFAEAIKTRSAYDTGVAVEYGDSFITLSTCSYHTTNGCLAVVAVKQP